MYILYPGETGEFVFDIPFSKTGLTKAVTTFSQDNHVVTEVESTSAAFTNNTNNSCKLTVSLTQKQSIKLMNLKHCLVQVNIVTSNGNRLVSRPLEVKIGQQLHRDVINP